MPSFAHILTASDELHEVLCFLPLHQVQKMADAIEAEYNLTGFFLRIRVMTIVFMGLIFQVLNTFDNSDIDISDFEIF